MQTFIDTECFDGTYTFKLSMDGIMAIEQKCGAGIGEVYARTLAGRYSDGETSFVNPMEQKFRASELLEVVRQGLIGGGKGYSDGRAVKVDSLVANHLIKTYISADRDNPLNRAWELAAAILHRTLYGYEPAIEDAQKKSVTETAPN